MSPGSMISLVLFLAFVGLCLRGMIRGITSMYGSDNREQSSGSVGSGLAGSFIAVDRLTRPNIVHVEKTRDVRRREDDVAGD